MNIAKKAPRYDTASGSCLSAVKGFCSQQPAVTGCVTLGKGLVDLLSLRSFLSLVSFTS